MKLRHLVIPAVLWLGMCLPVAAAPHEARLGLRDGKLPVGELSAVLEKQLHLPRLDLGGDRSIDVRGLGGSLFIKALDRSLGAGCDITVDSEALVLRFDPEKLPGNAEGVRRAIRIFTSVAAPDATGAQQRQYGLLLPQVVDVRRPLVILIHGLDCDRSSWGPMAKLLEGQGYQVGYFSYPSDEPIADSAARLGEQMRALRETFGKVPLDLIGHSMGALVARAYVEGDGYRGGVDHLILLAPPNHGSAWAGYRFALEVREHYQLWRNNPEWRWTWMITDGLGEAGGDLEPDSAFLKALNAQPRRAGVAYTILAGDRSCLAAAGADCVEAPARWMPAGMRQWWGIRQCGNQLERWGEAIRDHQGKSDGPVTLASTRLKGVEDVVVLPADHEGLYRPVDGQAPVAWAVIRDRLAR